MNCKSPAKPPILAGNSMMMPRQNSEPSSPATHSSSLLTVRDVADRLQLSIASVYMMIRKGTLIAHRLGGCNGAIRIRPEDLEQCLQVSTQQVIQNVAVPPTLRVKLKHIRLR